MEPDRKPRWFSHEVAHLCICSRINVPFINSLWEENNIKCVFCKVVVLFDFHFPQIKHYSLKMST